MKVTVERTFNLGNYENIRFSYEAEVPDKTWFDRITSELVYLCHVAQEKYKVNLLALKVAAQKEAEREAQLTPKLDAKGEATVERIKGMLQEAKKP